MRKILLSWAGLCLTLVTLAQTENVDTALMRRIREEEYTHSQVAFIAHQLSDVAGPRLTGSPGFKRAASWVVKSLSAWGLVNAAEEPWGTFGLGWETEHAYVALKAPYYQPMIAYPRAWTPSTPGLVSGKVFFLEALDSASIIKAGDSVKGAIILVKPKQTIIPIPLTADAVRFSADTLDRLPDFYMGTVAGTAAMATRFKNQYKAKKTLYEKGALALLSMSTQGRDGTIVVDGPWTQATGRYPALLPEGTLSTEEYYRLDRLDKDGTPAEVELDIRNRWYTKDSLGYNVVAELPGTDPALRSQLVMVGAHLDSWMSATGAADNGAGCAVMMEAVRLLKTLGVRPRRTIRIALWSGEEQGLLGSFGYVKKHFGNPIDMKLTPEQQKVSVYFNLDIGTGRIRGIYLQNNDSAGPIFKSWLAPFADLGATGITRNNIGSTDHLSFDAVGIPGFEFIQDPLDYLNRIHHSNMDSYDHLSIPDLQQAAIVVAGFVYDAAMRDGMIPRKPLPPPGKFFFDLDGLY
jgi:carboxypeptidase Q